MSELQAFEDFLLREFVPSILDDTHCFGDLVRGLNVVAATAGGHAGLLYVEHYKSFVDQHLPCSSVVAVPVTVPFTNSPETVRGMNFSSFDVFVLTFVD